MTKTPKNGSTSSTPTPGGGPASVGGSGGAPPSVGSTKSEPTEAASMSNEPAGSVHDPNRSGTPHSLPENSTKDTNEENTMNGGVSSSSNDAAGNLLCDNTNPEAGSNAATAGSAGGAETPNAEAAGGNSDNNDPGSVGAQVKSEDIKPNLSNCSTPLQPPNASSGLPSDTDLFEGFDSKDGVKVEADDSDNLAALTDFKEEDLKQFDDACNDFSNGK